MGTGDECCSSELIFYFNRIVKVIMIINYGIKKLLNPIKSQLSELIHGCMQSVLGLPEDKRVI